MVRALALALGLALAIATVGPAEACTLVKVKPGSAEAIKLESDWIDEIASSSTIFLAKVVADRSAELGEIWLAVRPGWGSPGRRVWFETETVLKGQVEPRPDVLMGQFGDTCGQGMTVSPGETVLVVAHKHDEFWEGYMAPASYAPKVRKRLKQQSRALSGQPR